jgi:hypothetical protein
VKASGLGLNTLGVIQPPGLDVLLQMLYELVQRHHAQIQLAAPADGHGA